MNSRLLVLAAAIIAGSTVYAKNIFNCDFEPGKWNKADFIEVKSSRWENVNTFKQEKCHIVNVCPKDATKIDMLSKRAPETYAVHRFNPFLCDLFRFLAFFESRKATSRSNSLSVCLRVFLNNS